MKLDTDLSWIFKSYDKPTKHTQYCMCCKKPLEKGDTIHKVFNGLSAMGYCSYAYYHSECMAYALVKNCEKYLTLNRKGKNKMKNMLDEIMVEEL